jgi:hypothetical protein
MGEANKTVAVVVIETPPVTPPPMVVTPPAGFATWCDWARKGLADALEGMRKAGGGVTEYHIGTRGLHRSGPADQIKNVDYWNEMVKLYCGVEGLPSSLTGRDTACRIIPRDV